MKIAVFGGSGFIGTHLVKRLKVEKGIDFICFNKNMLIKDDIRRFFARNKDIEYIINLVGVFSGTDDELIDINIKTLNNLLSSLDYINIRRIIYASSGAVYGEPSNKISFETDNLCPVTFYGLTKVFAEQILEFYRKKNIFEYTILRFPNVYGEGNLKGVIYNFVKSINEEGIVKIYGTGEQKRNFLYVGDAVSAITACLYSTEECSRIYNVADEYVYSLKDIVDILKSFGLIFDVQFLPQDSSNSLMMLSEDISLIKKELKWVPLVDLCKGLAKLVEYSK